MGQTEIMIWYYEKYKINPEQYWDVSEYYGTLETPTQRNSARKDVKNLFYWAVLQREMQKLNWSNNYRLSRGKVQDVKRLAKKTRLV